MSETSDSNLLQRSLNYQRRSVSVGDDPLLTITDDQSENGETNESTSYHQHIKPGENDGYICTPLARTNHRPTATTCWLVFSFSLFYQTTPALRSPFILSKQENGRFQFCFLL